MKMKHTEYIKALILAAMLALTGVWTIAAYGETPMTTSLERKPQTVTITREELGEQPPPVYGGDLNKTNMYGEYGTCVSEVVATIPDSASALERQVLMQQAKASCNDHIEAWHQIETAKYRAEQAEAQRPRWWYKLIPSADTLLGVGANVWMNTTNQKYQYRRDREMWDAISDIADSPPGNVEINGGEGAIDFNQGSPGSFSEGDFTMGLGDDSFNTDSRTNTDTRSNTDNTTTTFD